MPNIEEPNFELRDGPPGFRAKRARIGYELGSETVGVSLWELPPGEAAYPYHFHYSDEEVVIVLRGRPILRSPEGERVLEQGEAVRFQLGPEGAHQLHNPSAETVRFLALSSNGSPDIVVYPDSNKISASERNPDGEGLRVFFDRGDEADYWQGEEPPGGGSG
jgi:uncharacterized cupin superfamily protein